MGQDHDSLKHGAGARNIPDRTPKSPTEMRGNGARQPGGRPPHPPKK